MKAAAIVIAAGLASLTFDTLFEPQPPGWHRFASVTLWMMLWILAAQATVAIINRCKKKK